jgi:protein-arginine deiminase
MIRSLQDECVAKRELFEYFRKAGISAVQYLRGGRDEIELGGTLRQDHHIQYFKQQAMISWPHSSRFSWKETAHILLYFQTQDAQNLMFLYCRNYKVQLADGIA